MISLINNSRESHQYWILFYAPGDAIHIECSEYLWEIKGLVLILKKCKSGGKQERFSSGEIFWVCGTLSQRSLKVGAFSICLERSLNSMKATLGWAFLRRSTPELSTLSPQTGQQGDSSHPGCSPNNTLPSSYQNPDFAWVSALLWVASCLLADECHR